LQNWNKWLTDYSATNTVVTPAQTKAEWKKAWRERNTSQQWVVVSKARCTEPYTVTEKVQDGNQTIATQTMDENGTIVETQVPKMIEVVKTKKRLLSNCRILADKTFEEYQTVVPSASEAEAAANAPGGFVQQPDTTVNTVIPKAVWKSKHPSGMTAY
jgi:hypothetical protein